MNGKSLESQEATPVSCFLTRVRAEGEADSYSGKRGAVRRMDEVAIEVLSGEGRHAKVANVYMHNVSDGGCAFWSKKKMEPRTKVQLRACPDEGQDPWVSAQVAHCTVGIRGFLVGVTFEAA